MVDPARLHDAADRARLAAGPTSHSLAAFGVDSAELRLLEGGQGNTYSDGRLVLKSVGCVAEHDWICETYLGWGAHDEVRVPEPVRPTRGESDGGDHWSVDGWGAHVFVPGGDIDPTRNLGLIREVSGTFHRHLAGRPRPDFLADRDDPWAFGDRIAFEDADPLGDDELLDLAAELRSHQRPISSVEQPIHGDLLPNVLVAPGRPPAVIDWPLYYRPAAMADAIAITDAVTFRGVSTAEFDAWTNGPDWDQLLLRALLYRLGPTGFFTVRKSLMGSLVTHVQRVRPIARAVITRVAA